MAIVKKYKAEILSIVKHLTDVYTLEFFPIESRFKFDPGQFLHISLDPEYDGSGQWPESRCFSMQTSPSAPTIKITYAVKGGFTRQMERTLRVGSQVWLKLPYGNLFTQKHSKTNTVFIAGGTGITPFLSLFAYELFNDYINPRIYLGFRSESYNIYLDEINHLYNSSRFVKLFYQDIDGLLNIHNIFNENGSGVDYFISGPPLMIKSFKKSLVEKGIPVEHIITDDWE
jgi:propane monooxygenase reductase subunit